MIPGASLADRLPQTPHSPCCHFGRFRLFFPWFFCSLLRAITLMFFQEASQASPHLCCTSWRSPSLKQQLFFPYPASRRSSFLCLFSTPPSAGSCVAFQSNHPFPKQVTALPTPQKLCQESSRSLLLHTAKLSSKPKPCCLLYDLPRETKRLCPRRSHNAISNS